MPESVQSFVAKYHTTTEQLAELANKAKPKLLVIYHTVSFPPGLPLPGFYVLRVVPMHSMLRRKCFRKRSARDIHKNS